MGNVVQQMTLFFHQLLQLLRHFVELAGQLRQFVVAVIYLLGNTGFQLTRRQTIHTATQNANWFGDVVGQNVSQQQTNQKDKTENNDFMPNRRQWQTRNKQGTDRFVTLIFTAFDKKQIFLTQAIIFDVHHVRAGVFTRILTCQFNQA